MTLMAAQVRVAGTGEISVAPVGSTPPADASTALDTSFKGLGYDTDNGVTVSRSMNTNDIAAWQSMAPVRRVVQDQAFSLAAEFMQSNPTVASLYLATGAFAATTSVPTDYGAAADVNAAIIERSVVMEYMDGSVKYRVYIPKAQVSANGDQTLSRTAAVLYPLLFTALAPDTGTELFHVYTNDASMAPAA